MKEPENKFELATQEYWKLSLSCRHPNTPTYTAGMAISMLTAAEDIIDSLIYNTEHAVHVRMHEIKFDIIEGNDAWRRTTKQKLANISKLTPSTNR